MSEFGDFEFGPPQEGGEAAQEGLSEAAKARFAAAAQAAKQLRRDEKRAKKKDDQVAKAIIQFLNDDRFAHLFKLISHLVSRNCPSIFILGILSLIHKDCRTAVLEFFSEKEQQSASEVIESELALTDGQTLKNETTQALVEWITRLQLLIADDTRRILESLLIDEKHLDGSVLQITIFVLQEFFRVTEGKELSYEKAQPLTASILQAVFEPFLAGFEKKALESAEEDEE